MQHSNFQRNCTQFLDIIVYIFHTKLSCPPVNVLHIKIQWANLFQCRLLKLFINVCEGLQFFKCALTMNAAFQQRLLVFKNLPSKLNFNYRFVNVFLFDRKLFYNSVKSTKSCLLVLSNGFSISETTLPRDTSKQDDMAGWTYSLSACRHPFHVFVFFLTSF